LGQQPNQLNQKEEEEQKRENAKGQGGDEEAAGGARNRSSGASPDKKKKLRVMVLVAACILLAIGLFQVWFSFRAYAIRADQDIVLALVGSPDLRASFESLPPSVLFFRETG
jgi:hypothetical protein